MPDPGTVVDTVRLPAGGDVVIRYVDHDDAAMLLEYINALLRERTFIVMQGEQLSLAQEQGWLERCLAEGARGDGIHLVVVVGDRVVGVAGLSRRSGVQRHVATLGISLAADVRDVGLGSRLLRRTLHEGERHLHGLRIVQLDVFGTTARAYALYEKHGFVEHGRLPAGIAHQGEYVDSMSMYRRMGRDAIDGAIR